MIQVLFNTLFFVIPLIFYKNTSELFEFNKIIVLYGFTAIISLIWIINSIKTRSFIFRRTILDWPLVIYLSIYLISTLFSIDPRTSWLGYYSRFNGGLVSQICYVILYWAFVSNLNKNNVLRITNYVLAGTLIASIFAILEHFGIFITCGLMSFGYKESCWIQDVQTRVFSTLGQPNWLAALLAALIPISWAYSLRHKQSLPLRDRAYSLFSILFFVTLLFTKSRSGLLAFGVEFIIFWGFIFYKEKLKYLKEFLILLCVSTVLVFIFQINPKPYTLAPSSQGNSLETGGTESGVIRKYVWLGAWEVFKHYPILGSGPETFAFSFPMYKPVLHNLTSEWDFIYNKAHNEYLNYLANVGLFGFVSYLTIIIVSIIQIIKVKDQKAKAAFLSGYTAILITNFFGFSVVPVSLLFFLFPAIAVVSITQKIELPKQNSLNIIQRGLIIAVILTTCYILHTTYSYWQADIYYNKAKNLNAQNHNMEAISEIEKAIKLSKEPQYFAESAISYSEYAITLAQKNSPDDEVKKYVKSAFTNIQEAIAKQPQNSSLLKNLSSLYYKFAIFNRDYLTLAEEPLLSATYIAPNDPKIVYQLGILNIKNGKAEDGIKNLEKSVQLKPNYKEGRFALGVTYLELKNYVKAKENLEYILKNIDPNDELTKKYLEKI